MPTLLLLNLICPFDIILVGVILKKHPASNMHRHNGYNTPTARKSQTHWDYAQKIAPDIFITFGKYLFMIEIIISVILFFLKASDEVALMTGVGIGIAWLCIIFYHTDKKIKERFAEK